MTAIDTALLVLRLWLGVVMIAHGVNHGRSLEGTADWLAKKGFRNARLNAMVSSANEIALGVLLIAGFLTSLAVAGVAGTMLVAFWAIHRRVGFFNFHRPDEGYEYVATLALVALAVAVAGPGAAAVDTAIGLAPRLDGWAGAAIVAGGILVAAGQLAVFWRQPVEG